MSTMPNSESNPEHVSGNCHQTTVRGNRPARCWLLRRLWSQNPFYLLSVFFVLHAVAHWYNADSGATFSPWPLLWVITGYTLLLALTGFVVIRIGRVWDDARSILLIILLLFVELSLVFDETLVSDPKTGRMLLVLCWGFSAALSELLLRGLRIVLPWLYRLPYHGLLALLFFYPLSLVSMGTRLSADDVVWRIFLFPTAAAVVVLGLIPAIRRGSDWIRNNGTPWLWPWYPWSLFVFFGVCLCFRSYALSQSFDPVLGESNQSAMAFASAFGVYFLIPLLFACGVVLMEVGLVERRRVAVGLAMCIPILCQRLSIPASSASGPYFDFLQRLISQAGSPVWISLVIASLYYGYAIVRGVRSAELCLSFALLILTRVDPRTIDISTLAQPVWWPLVILSVFQFCLSLGRHDSRRMLIAALAATAALNLNVDRVESITPIARYVMTLLSVIGSILLIGAVFNDDFAWLLKLVGAPLLVVATILGIAFIGQMATTIPFWIAPAFVAAMTLVAWLYGKATRMPLYRLASLLCGTGGTAGLLEMTAVYFIRESEWHGAKSFVVGISCLAIAATISSWKAGWLKTLSRWLREMLIIPMPELRPME